MIIPPVPVFPARCRYTQCVRGTETLSPLGAAGPGPHTDRTEGLQAPERKETPERWRFRGFFPFPPGAPDNPAEGYYEWQKTEDGKKIPHYLYSEKNDLLAFAGLYEFWPDPSLPEDDPNKWLLSCTVLTTTAHDTLGNVHDRAPGIIPPEMFADWLDPDTQDKAKVQDLLDRVPEPVLTPRIVSDRVNSVRNNGPELVEPAKD